MALTHKTTVRYPGIGDRIRQRLRELGYWKAERADVSKFCTEKGYLTQSVYGWMKGVIPSYDNLVRLARDLETTPEYILLNVPSREAAPVSQVAAGDMDRSRPTAPTIGKIVRGRAPSPTGATPNVRARGARDSKRARRRSL
jgi:hypothetical protein